MVSVPEKGKIPAGTGHRAFPSTSHPRTAETDVVQEGSFAKTSISQEGQPEEMAVRSECLKKLKESLEQLPEQEAYLIYLLFFEEVTVKEAAQICGCSRKTIQNRKKRILKTLKNIMKELGIEGGCIYFN